MAYFIAGDDDVAKKEMKIQCEKCGCDENVIPIGIGDITILCAGCGRYIHYFWRENKTEISSRPERKTSSGLTFY